MRPAAPFVTVARECAGETVVCVGTGPSLTAADVDACLGRARVIAINDAYRLAPWADVLYAADAKWWRWHRGAPTFQGRKLTIAPQPEAWPGLGVLRNTGAEGLECDPTGLRTGFHSGYQAINLAVHLGAARIVLLGYDLRGTHFFGAHPDGTVPPFVAAQRALATLAAPLTAAGIAIVNATRDTALTCFPRAPIEAVLREVAA
jgi:hypothetical protein